MSVTREEVRAMIRAIVTPRVLSQLVPKEKVLDLGSMGSSKTIPVVTNGTMLKGVLNSATCAITTPTAVEGLSFSMKLTQDGTGGRAITLDSQCKPDGGSGLTLSTAANAIDSLWFACFDDGEWLCGFGGMGHS